METLEDEPEEEEDTYEKSPYILQSEVEKAIKEMKNKKAAGDDGGRCAQIIGRRWVESNDKID
jgi:hypothetical protein